MTAPPNLKWPAPAGFPHLGPREIHLWCAWLDGPDVAPADHDMLSPDEVARAASYHFEPDRHRFVAARRNLRQVLAAYVGREPAALVFKYGRFGKPILVHRADASGPFDPTLNNLCFNQSHCGALWLLAVAWNQPLGVDLEQIRDFPDLDLLETKLFPPGELARRRALAVEDRRAGFFERWTQREAAVKFQGLGFDPAAAFVPPDRSELLTPVDGYVGFLAYGGAAVRIRRLAWRPALLQRPEVHAPPDSLGVPLPPDEPASWAAAS